MSWFSCEKCKNIEVNELVCIKNDTLNVRIIQLEDRLKEEKETYSSSLRYHMDRMQYVINEKNEEIGKLLDNLIQIKKLYMEKI